MQDEETRAIIIILCEKAFLNPNFEKKILNRENRIKAFYDKRGRTLKYGLNVPLYEALVKLPNFENLEDFQKVALEIEIDYSKGVERR